MRQINIELNKTKLELKKQQLYQIENQLTLLKAKLEAVSQRYDAKALEVFELETLLNGTVSTPAVSE